MSLAIILTLTACAQPPADGLEGIYSRGSESLYFKDGHCYFFKEWADDAFRRQEKYAYTHDNKEIKFKYTGDFQQKYDGDQVTTIWWRLRDERLRERMAYDKMASLKEWFAKRYKNFAADAEKKLYVEVVKQNASVSQAQFEECLKAPKFFEYLGIETEENQEFTISGIVLRIYEDLKKSGTLLAKAEVPKVEKKEVLSSEQNVKWSDWSYIIMDYSDDPVQFFAFRTYFFAGDELTLQEKMFKPKRKPAINIYYTAELIKNGKRMGIRTKDHKGKSLEELEVPLTQSIWQEEGGNFFTGEERRIDGRAYRHVLWQDMTDGSYEIKINVNEEGGVVRTKTFPFQIKNGQVVGDIDISTKDFKKKHDITRFDGEQVFLNAQ